MNGHRDYVIESVLHGLSGPIDGRTYPQVMVPIGSNNDHWIADVASFVRNSFGNSGALASTADVARVRAATGARGPWTVAELEASLPHALVPDSTWKVTASHDARPAPQANADGGYNYLSTAAGALTFLGWTTGAPQRAGMWFQIELPGPAMLTELQFTSSRTGDDGAARGWTFPRRYQVQVSTDGNDMERASRRRRGTSGYDHRHLCAAESTVRANHTDGCRRERAAVVDAARASLRGAGQSGRTEVKRPRQ